MPITIFICEMVKKSVLVYKRKSIDCKILIILLSVISHGNNSLYIEVHIANYSRSTMI